MTYYSSLNLTNSKDIVANSIALKGPDGSLVDITNLFATQSQLNGINGNIDLSNYPTKAALTNSISSFITTSTSGLINYPTNASLTTTLASYPTNTALTNSISGFITNSTSGLTNYPSNTSLATTLANYPTNTALTNSISGFITNSTTGLINYPSNTSLTTALALKAPLSNPIFTGSISTPAITLNGTSLATTLATFLTTASLATYAPLANPIFTGSISTPAITLSGTSLTSTLALKAPLTNPTFTGLSTDTLTATGNISTSGGNITSSTGSMSASSGVLGSLVVNGTAVSYFVAGANPYKALFDTTGRFGIGMDYSTGTTTPNVPLHVIGDSTSFDGTCQFASRKSGCTTNQSHIHYGTTADWLIRSGNSTGIVKIQDTGGSIQLGSSGSYTTLPGSIADQMKTSCTTTGSTNAFVLQNFYTNGTTTSAQLWLRGTTTNTAKEYLMAYDGVNGMEFRNVGYLATKFTQQNGTITALALDTTGLMTLVQPPALNYSGLPIIASNQIGYSNFGTSQSTANLSTTMLTYQSITLGLGVYVITGVLAHAAITSATGVGVYLYAGAGQISTGYSYGITSLTAYVSQQITCIVSNTSSSTTYNLRAGTNTGTATYVTCYLQAIRIA